MIYLENETMEVSISLLGAELQSLKKRGCATEYLWQGDPDVLAMRAPVLFPVIGRPAEGAYRVEGQRYPMELHGFARHQSFEPVEVTDCSAVLRLTSTPETRGMYPFSFELDLTYNLGHHSIRTDYTVRNTGAGPMWFSLGTHTGFPWPLYPEDTDTDYCLVFAQEETAGRRYIEDFMLNGRRGPLLEKTRELGLNLPLFRDKALITEGLKSRKVTLNHRTRGPVLTMDYEDFPYFTVWSNRDTGKVLCLEPWYGVPPSSETDAPMNQWEGVQQLQPGEVFRCGFGITLH